MKDIIKNLKGDFKKYNVLFSGIDIMFCEKPFQFLRKLYGDIKVCFIKFFDTSLCIESYESQYKSLVLTSIFKPNTPKQYFPKTECIDSSQKDWIDVLFRYTKCDSKLTLIILGGIVWEDELKIHEERIDAIFRRFNELTKKID